jgi:RNA-directed DNA polymerase
MARSSAQGAVWWVREAINRGDRWVAESDIVGFFDHIRHGRLLRELPKEVDDPEVIGLIRRWLRAEVCTDEGLVPTHSGTPQGGVISPLLANIYLHRLDVEVGSASSG